MAKKDKNEDEYKNENFDNSSNQDDEDFGLPNLDDDSDDKEETEHQDTPSQEEESASSSTYYAEEETESTYYADTQDPNDPVYEENVYEEEKTTSGYIPPQKPSILPVIITLSIIVILACVAVWYLFIREPEPKVTEQPVVKDTSSYVVEKPVEVEEPVIEEPEIEEPEIGTVNTLSSRTGRSYVVVGSFFDADMAQDYANELAQDGISAYVIPPFGKSKFNRVAIEETSSFAEASSRATELAGQFKETPWPLKY